MPKKVQTLPHLTVLKALPKRESLVFNIATDFLFEMFLQQVDYQKPFVAKCYGTECTKYETLNA